MLFSWRLDEIDNFGFITLKNTEINISFINRQAAKSLAVCRFLCL